LCLSVCCFSTPPPAEHHTPSLHDALPISPGAGKRAQISATTVDSPSRGRKLRRVLERAKRSPARSNHSFVACLPLVLRVFCAAPDRKSTRLNSSHVKISYAVFCLKKKTLS